MVAAENNPVRDHGVMMYVYIIESRKNGKWYIGMTNNLRKRFWQHSNGQSPYTKGRGPWKLIYYEASIDEEDARSRELYLKSGMGRRYLRNRMKRFLSLTG